MSEQDALCICPTECDCQRPPPDDPAERDGVYGVSESCPIHNDDPDPHPECPLHGHPEIRIEAAVIVLFSEPDPGDRDVAAYASMYLYIESLGNLAINMLEDALFASFEFEVTDDCRQLGTVSLPTGLVEQALGVARAEHVMMERAEKLGSWSEEVRGIISKADLKIEI